MNMYESSAKVPTGTAVACALGERVLWSLEAPIARQEALATGVFIGRPRGAQRMLRAAGGGVARPR